MDDESKGNEIAIEADERSYIVGRTRSGKSTLARYLLRSPRRLVACDPKRSLGDWKLESWNRETREALLEGRDVRVRVTPEPGAKPEEFWETILRTVFNAGDCILYVDEVYLLTESESPTGYPPALRDIWTGGGEQGIGAFAISQRPRFIPKYLISEAEHFFVFRLLLEADRQYVADFTHPRLEQKIPLEHKHGFWYMSIFDDEPIYIPQLETGHGEGWGQVMELEPAEEAEESGE
jgi:hypothetical protein